MEITVEIVQFLLQFFQSAHEDRQGAQGEFGLSPVRPSSWKVFLTSFIRFQTSGLQTRPNSARCARKSAVVSMITIGSICRLHRLHRLQILTILCQRGSPLCWELQETLMRWYHSIPSLSRPINLRLQYQLDLLVGLN